MEQKWMDAQSYVFAPVGAWVWCMGSTTDPQGVKEFMQLRAEHPAYCPRFPLHITAWGELLVVVNWIWGIQALLCKLQGHSVVCGEGCLFLFCIFTLKYVIFFIRVKICQMAISDFLEIMRFWNLLKHKCQKKITAEFVWPFLFYSLMLTFLVC